MFVSVFFDVVDFFDDECVIVGLVDVEVFVFEPCGGPCDGVD
jgi:hypothetical protein